MWLKWKFLQVSKIITFFLIGMYGNINVLKKLTKKRELIRDIFPKLREFYVIIIVKIFIRKKKTDWKWKKNS